VPTNAARRRRNRTLTAPPAEYLAFASEPAQRGAARLLQRHAQFGDGDELQAVDRVVRIVRELDRYHGFATVPRPPEESEPLRLPPPAESPIALGPTVGERIEIGAGSD
jgi:hypothetical protein